MGAAAAVILRKQRDIIEVYEGARAISAETARDPIELGLDQDLVFKGLIRRAVLREGAPGHYYVDEPTWTALNARRRRILYMLAAVAAIIFLLGISRL